MSYYEKKVKAYSDIDTLLREGTDIDVIIYKISTRYGFSKKVVHERINQLKKIQDRGV